MQTNFGSCMFVVMLWPIAVSCDALHVFVQPDKVPEGSGQETMNVLSSIETLNVISCSRECLTSQGCWRGMFNSQTRTCHVLGATDMEGNVTVTVDFSYPGWHFYMKLGYQDQGMSNCDETWSYFNGFCYWVSYFAASWGTAKSLCAGSNASLVSVKTQPLQEFLNSIVASTLVQVFPDPDVRSMQYTWTSGSDASTEGWFAWADSSLVTSFFTNWLLAGDKAGGPDCLAMKPFYDNTGVILPDGGKWEDRGCNSSAIFICEKQSLGGV